MSNRSLSKMLDWNIITGKELNDLKDDRLVLASTFYFGNSFLPTNKLSTNYGGKMTSLKTLNFFEAYTSVSVYLDLDRSKCLKNHELKLLVQGPQ